MKIPLYDNLYKKSNTCDLTVSKKKKLVKLVNDMNDNEHELLYMLVRNYQMEHYDNTLTVPYNGKFDENKLLVFNIDNFPNRLKNMIYHFSVMNKKTKTK